MPNAEPDPEPAPDPDVTARLLRRRLEQKPLELPVSGSSMGSTITSGSVVTVEGSHPRCGEVWACAFPEGRIFVHRIRHLADDHVVLRGDGNLIDDPMVRRSWLIGRVKTAKTGDGSPRSFGELDRLFASARLRGRFVLRRLVGRGRAQLH